MVSHRALIQIPGAAGGVLAACIGTIDGFRFGVLRDEFTGLCNRKTSFRRV